MSHLGSPPPALPPRSSPPRSIHELDGVIDAGLSALGEVLASAIAIGSTDPADQFEHRTFIDDNDRIVIGLVPLVAHWRLAEPDGTAGVRLIERLVEVFVEHGSDTESATPRRKPNGTWVWAWSYRGLRFEALCVAEPGSYQAWCRHDPPERPADGYDRPCPARPKQVRQCPEE